MLFPKADKLPALVEVFESRFLVAGVAGGLAQHRLDFGLYCCSLRVVRGCDEVYQRADVLDSFPRLLRAADAGNVEAVEGFADGFQAGLAALQGVFVAADVGRHERGGDQGQRQQGEPCALQPYGCRDSAGGEHGGHGGEGVEHGHVSLQAEGGVAHAHFFLGSPERQDAERPDGHVGGGHGDVEGHHAGSEVVGGEKHDA